MPIGATQAAGMGLGFIGGQMQGWAALLDKWAMQDAYQAELDRQQAYKEQALKLFNTQLAKSGSAAARSDMSDAYAERLGLYNTINKVPLGFNVAGQGSASPARDVAAARLAAGQRADLMKYGDWLQGQKIQNMQTGRGLDQITNFAGGTARVFPYRMYSAQHSMDALANAGAAIASAGGALSGGKIGGPLMDKSQPNYGYPGGMSTNDFWNQYFNARGGGRVDPYFGAALALG